MVERNTVKMVTTNKGLVSAKTEEKEEWGPGSLSLLEAVLKQYKHVVK